MRRAICLCLLLALAARVGADDPKLVATLEGHKEEVRDLAFYPDGKTLVTAGRDGTLRLWDVTTGKEVKALRKQERGFLAVAASRDGPVLAAIDGTRDVRLWPKGAGDPVVLTADAAVWTLALSGDGATLAAGTAHGELWLWDVATRARLARIDPGRSSIDSLAFFTDGKTVATEGAGVVHLWDVPGRGRKVAELTRNSALRALATAPDGRSIATSRDFGLIELCDLKTAKWRTLAGAREAPIVALAFSPNGKLLAGGSYSRGKDNKLDGTVTLWDVAGEKEYRVLTGHGTEARSLAFSANGRLLAVGTDEGSVKVWHMPPAYWGGGRQGYFGQQGAQTGLRCVALRPDGKEVAAGGDDGSVFVWEVGKEAPRLTLKGHTRAVLALAYSPDGKSLLSAGLDGTPRLWDAASGKERAALAGHKAPVLCAAFAPDGKAMATGDSSGFLRVGDGVEWRAFKAHKGPLRGLAFTPDGKSLLSAGSDGAVRQWAAAGGEPVERLKLDSGVVALALARDGKALYLADRNGWLTCLDLATGKSRRVLSRPHEMVQAVAISDDGKTLAVSGRLDEVVRLYAAADGKELAVMDWHTDWVSGVAFAAGGKLLVTASMDASLRLWRLPAGIDK